MGGLFTKLFRAFYSKQLEVVLVGLENSGKTTVLNVLSQGAALETVPTIGLNVKFVKKGSVTMKCWDIGGQQVYRSEWGRYAKGCDCIIFVVDAYDVKKLRTARKELHRLLEIRELATIPVLVLANKIDLEPHIKEHELIRELNLDYVVDNPWLVIPCSALRNINMGQVIEWLIHQGEQ